MSKRAGIPLTGPPYYGKSRRLTTLASKEAREDDAGGSLGLLVAPTYRPTPEEWRRPYEYIASIRQEAQTYGLCKIVPPKDWSAPFSLKTENFRLITKLQPVHQLQYRISKVALFHCYLDMFLKDTMGYGLILLVLETHSELDAHELYRQVVRHGGYMNVVQNSLLGKVLEDSNCSPSLVPMNAFRCYYERYLLPYEYYHQGAVYIPELLEVAQDSEALSGVRRVNMCESAYAGVSFSEKLGPNGPHQYVNALPNRTVSTSPLASKSQSDARPAMPTRKQPGYHSSKAVLVQCPNWLKQYVSSHFDDVDDSAELRIAVVGLESRSEYLPIVAKDEIPLYHHLVEAMAADAKEEGKADIVDALVMRYLKTPWEGYVTWKSVPAATFPQFAFIRPMQVKAEGLTESSSFEFMRSWESKDDQWFSPHCENWMVEPWAEHQELELIKDISAFGFQEGEEFTFSEYKSHDEHFRRSFFSKHLKRAGETKEVPLDVIEKKYWEVVNTGRPVVQVEYGNDLDCIKYGSAFPRKHASTAQGNSSWFLTNLPTLPGSLLQNMPDAVQGVTDPWFYCGMTFASFCWHTEDLYLYSVNYMHQGGCKQWYGIPGDSALLFEKIMRKHLSVMYGNDPNYMYLLNTQLDPTMLKAKGVPVCSLIQNPGEFVITFPAAYHAGFSYSWNCAEAVNFALPDWIPWARKALQQYRLRKRMPVLCLDRLVVVTLIQEFCHYKINTTSESESHFSTAYPDRYRRQWSAFLFGDLDHIIDSESKWFSELSRKPNVHVKSIWEVVQDMESATDVANLSPDGRDLISVLTHGVDAAAKDLDKECPRDVSMTSTKNVRMHDRMKTRRKFRSDLFDEAASSLSNLPCFVSFLVTKDKDGQNIVCSPGEFEDLCDYLEAQEIDPKTAQFTYWMRFNYSDLMYIRRRVLRNGWKDVSKKVVCHTDELKRCFEHDKFGWFVVEAIPDV